MRWSLLFDLDGTLIDTAEFLVACARHAFDGFDGSVPSDAEWVAGIGTPLRSQFAQYARGEAEVERLVRRYRAFQHEHHDRLTRCFDGAVDTVRALRGRGHPIAIVTSKGEELAHRGLAWVGLAAYVDTVVGVESSTRHKPDPEPVRVALARLGGAAERALFVGDSPHDVRAGNAAGVVTVAALWGPFSREQLAEARPTHYLGRITELPGLVERIERAHRG